MKKHFDLATEGEAYYSFRVTDGTDARDILTELKKRIDVRHAEADEDELLVCLWRDDTPAINGAGRIIIDAVADIAQADFMWFSVDHSLKCERYVSNIADEYDLDRVDARGLLEQIEETTEEIAALVDEVTDYTKLIRYENLKTRIELLYELFDGEINDLNRVRAMLQWDFNDALEDAEYSLEHSGAAV